MKKIICVLLSITLLFTSAETAFAKKNNAGKKNKHQITQNHGNNHDDNNHEDNNHEDNNHDDNEHEDNIYEGNNHEDKNQEFRINGSPVIKYGKYKLPIMPITKGMGATVTLDETNGVLTVKKDTIAIVINFKHKTVTVNGVTDKNSGIFKAKNNKKTTVLIKYIANILGVNVSVDRDKVIVEVRILDLPTNIIISPIGTTVITNILNNTTLYLTATAKITANQAVGGKAELYVGTKLVATDASIAATDTAVTFTTSDGSPTNAELMSVVPSGGVVTVRLYNANKIVVTSKVSNPTLVVDYVAPTITGINSAVYNTAGSQINLTVTGESAIGDQVDVTKFSLYDPTLGKIYQLTNVSGTGSNGAVISANSVVINIGTADKLGLTGFGSSTGILIVSVGSLLKDAAGNTSPSFSGVLNIPLTVSNILNPPIIHDPLSVLDPPTNVSITPIGTTVKVNTLNRSTLTIVGRANVIAGQATGGRAELYVGNILVATDTVITASDTSVTFTISDNTPTNAELQAAIPAGGLVTVKLYNVANNSVISSIGNPMLVVDYIAPTITGITSAVYNFTGNQIYLYVNGAGSLGDSVDVTKIILYSSTLGSTYQLTNNSVTGSNGVVNATDSLVINIGSFDKLAMTGFGYSNIFLTVSIGPLIIDAAGNTSPGFTTTINVPLSVMN